METAKETLAVRFVRAKREKARCAAEEKEWSAEATRLGELLRKEMLDNSLSKVTLEVDGKGTTVYLKESTFVSPLEGQKDALIQALIDEGLGHLVPNSYNANTLRSWANEARKGGTLPDSVAALLKFTTQDKAETRNVSAK